MRIRPLAYTTSVLHMAGTRSWPRRSSYQRAANKCSLQSTCTPLSLVLVLAFHVSSCASELGLGFATWMRCWNKMGAAYTYCSAGSLFCYRYACIQRGGLQLNAVRKHTAISVRPMSRCYELGTNRVVTAFVWRELRYRCVLYPCVLFFLEMSRRVPVCGFLGFGLPSCTSITPNYPPLPLFFV